MEKESKNCLVLMTALVPTTGHLDLIKFAQKIPETHVHVIINGRTFEPTSLSLRAKALRESLTMDNVTIYEVMDDGAPQSPKGERDLEFWAWWRASIAKEITPVKKWDYVAASEGYGQRLAEELGALFIPYDVARIHNGARGVDARQYPQENWEKLLPAFRKHYAQRAVMFGQESVGKTTVSKILAEILGGDFLEEWARPYLEMGEIGTEVTDEKMRAIATGQGALERAFRDSSPTPFQVLDTDLYSTIGYWRIYGKKEPQYLKDWARELSMGKIYFVLPDDIPFEKDKIRYGGDKRESEKQLWIDLLKEFDLPYVIVPSGSAKEKAEFIAKILLENFANSWHSIREFKRD